MKPNEGPMKTGGSRPETQTPRPACGPGGQRKRLSRDRPEYPEAKTVWYCPTCEEPRDEDEIIGVRCTFCGTEVEERDE